MRKLLLASAALFCAGTALAVPAKPTPITITQPDGTEMTVMLRGDERSHYYLSEDGYLLVNSNDAYYYGNVDASGAIAPSPMLARPRATRSAEEWQYLQRVDMDRVYDVLRMQGQQAAERRQAASAVMRAPALTSDAGEEDPAQEDHPSYGVGKFSGTHFPAYGEQKGLAVIVQYTDVHFTISDPYDHFYRMLNEPGYSDYGGTGSAYDYFCQASDGQFTPQFDVYGPLTLSHNQAYYGGNDWWGNDQYAYMMGVEACQQLDDEVDFTQYDRDGDGYIDNIYVFYAGRGEASGGSANTVWPHSWEVSAGTSIPYYFDGVRLDHYACSNEIEAGNTPDGIGTFVHEFSHVLGLPDLYETTYSSGAFTPGAYSVMDVGPYNNDGRTPPTYSTYERNALGWMRPVIATPDKGEVTLEPLADSNVAYMIPTNDYREFFLVENRQQTGWDTYLPGHGLLVWHIDYDEELFNGNNPNKRANHQCVDIVEADDVRSESTRNGDTFPGKQGVTEFTPYTKPALVTWSGQALDVPLTGITENSKGQVTVTFGYVGLEEPDTVQALPAENVTCTSFRASWEKVDNASFYRVSVKHADGSYLSGWNHKDVGNVDHVNVKNLTPATDYSYVVTGVNQGLEGPASNEVQVRTLDPTIDFFKTVATDATDINDVSFTANWEPVDLAVDYLFDLTVDEPCESMVDVVDFTGGLRKMPEGWTTDAMFTYNTEGKYGEAAPSLRFTKAGYLQSPLYTDDVRSVEFWHRGVSTDRESTFLLRGYVDGWWTTIATIPVNNDSGAIYRNDSLPDRVRRIRIEYTEKVRQGNGVIDDVKVVWGGASVVNQPVEDYHEIRVGDVSSLEVNNLLPAHTYYYTVQATDGQLWASKSSKVRVTTLEEHVEGLTSIVDNRTEVAIVGNTIVAMPEASIYSVDGRLVGNGTVQVRPGVYIVTAPSRLPVKVVVR